MKKINKIILIIPKYFNDKIILLTVYNLILANYSYLSNIRKRFNLNREKYCLIFIFVYTTMKVEIKRISENI